MKQAVRAIIVREGKLLVMKRNKFGKKYYTLIGGHIELSEEPEQALVREVYEETSLKITHAKKVFLEHADAPYGLQHIYLCKDPGGDVEMREEADETHINRLGMNTYTPMWLPLSKLEDVEFLSGKLKGAILHGLKNGFPRKIQQL